jgi:hypothetical protein
MTEPTRGTRYRSLNDVICFDRIPLVSENANRLERDNQANVPSSNHADEPIPPTHCVPPTVNEATPSAGHLTEMLRRSLKHTASLLPVLCGASWLLFIAESPALLDQQNTIDTPAGVTGRATNEQSLDEFVLAAYQPTSYAHALKSELPASINLEESRPITTTDQLVAVPGLNTPPLSIDSTASSLFEPAYTLHDATLPFARATQPRVSSDDDLLPPQERPGSNHSQTPNLSAPPEASHTVPERVTEVAGPPASVAPPASTQTERPSAPSSSAARDDLVARGRALLGQGDVGSARILLLRAFDAGAPSASFFLAQSYDPNVLASRHTYGASADLTKARQFYEHAHRLGMREAEQRLGSLNNGSARDRAGDRQHRFSGHVTQRAE